MSEVVTEDSIKETLKDVVDPELGLNIVDLGLIYGITIKTEPDKKPDIAVKMTLTTPACPYGPMLMGQIPTALKKKYNDEIGEVTVDLTFEPFWDPSTMASEDVKFELGIW